FLASDWRFAGTPHFQVAIPARLSVVLMSLICFAALARVGSMRGLCLILGLWQITTALAVSLLVRSHSDIALFVVLMLPIIYYFALSLPFRQTVAGGMGCSAVLLVGFLDGTWAGATTPGLVLASLVLNSALVLVTMQSNRLRRLEWAAVGNE